MVLEHGLIRYRMVFRLARTGVHMKLACNYATTVVLPRSSYYARTGGLLPYVLTSCCFLYTSCSDQTSEQLGLALAAGCMLLLVRGETKGRDAV